ncbi:MAG: dioxygenase [Burkholderiaceae bacterium]
MAQLESTQLAPAVIARMDDCADARFKRVMSSLVTHLHAFALEVDLMPDEWMAAIEFLTAAGKMCDDKRQEFILLSDTLGLSMLVVAMDQERGKQAAQAAGARTAGATPATEATVQGPFYWEGAPEVPLGADITAGAPGEPAWYSGRVTGTDGLAVADCVIDIWSGDGEGMYDMQYGADAGMRLRARIRTDAEGRYRFWSIKPSYYPVPDDGPVGGMLRRMGRHPNRPGHIHTMVYAPGYQKLTTHLFVSDSPYLDSDAVFGVRDSLIVDYTRHPPGAAPDGRTMSQPWHSASFDFKLVPTIAPVATTAGA